MPQPNYELELARLVLQWKNVDYEELPAEDQELTFAFLEKKAKVEIGIETLSRDVLKTLNLYSDAQGYNLAAEFLADKNYYPGIDIARFGVDINTILMFDDRIEVTWPGGLPAEEYLKGNFSVLRNPILGNIFYRLHLVEILGTGVRRIRESYRYSASKPDFEVLENSIKVTLPVMNTLELSEDEELVYKALSKTMPRSSGEITEAVPFGKSKTTTILKKLVKNNYVTVVGRGRGTKYKL